MITPSFYSTMVRAGKTTYFIDLKQAKNGNYYLNISEARLTGEGGRQRSTIRVFHESMEPFQQAVQEALAAVPKPEVRL